jgi:threonine synthase
MNAGIWRYADQLPETEERCRITLGEGATPLIDAPRLAEATGVARLLLKLEFCNPTGSFKDRGTAFVVSQALAAGAKELVEDSSGNAGASAAAYAARAGMRCTVFAPASAPIAKLRQAEAHGARVVAVQGTRADVAAAARRAARGSSVTHLDHNASDLFVAGVSTLGLELLDALDGDSGPVSVVASTGGGSIVAGLRLACEMRSASGARALQPRLFAAQSEACAPLVRALEAGWDDVAPVEALPTIAGGISIAAPPRGRVLLRALRDSNGGAVAVAEEAIARWGKLLARLEGIYAEPTAAAAVAGVARLAALDRFPARGVVVAIVSGGGLKDLENSAR